MGELDELDELDEMDELADVTGPGAEMNGIQSLMQDLTKVSA